jgi:serine/threonine protein kinase
MDLYQYQEVNKLFEREVMLLKLIKSPNVVKIHDVLKSQSSFYLILDYCNGGTLADLVKSRKILTEVEAHYLVR